MNRLKRNTGHKRSKSGPPYNPVYDAFSSVFSKVFSDRLPPGERPKIYVPLPEVERRLDDYVADTRPYVCVVHGLTGAGKSTLLDHYAAEGEHRIYLDFTGRRQGMPDWSLDFADAGPVDRRIKARAAINTRLNELLLQWCGKYRSFINLQFYNFLYRFHLAELGNAALVAEDDEEKRDILKDFCKKKDSTAFVRCLMEYVSRASGFDHLLIVVDNVDEQALETVEALFFCLSDMISCLCRPRGIAAGDVPFSSVSDTRFRAVLSCRTQTLSILLSDPDGIIQTRGYTSIELQGPSILSEIVLERLRSVDERDLVQQSPFMLRTGAQVVNADPAKLIRKLCDELVLRAIEARVFALLNNNYRSCLDHLRYFLQNRYFLTFDEAYFQASSYEGIGHAFTFSRMLRAMAYGNPVSADHMYYPARSTQIANILEWNIDDGRTFYAVLKLLQWLKKESGHEAEYTDIGCRVRYAKRTFNEKYGIGADSLCWAMRYAHAGGAIFSGSGNHKDMSDDDEIYVSPRGHQLLDLLFSSSLLFEIYKDDLCSPRGDRRVLEDRPAVPAPGVGDRYPSRHNFQDTLKWLRALAAFEDEVLADIARSNSSAASETLLLFDGLHISAHLLRGLRRSVDVVYKHVITAEDARELAELVASMERHAASLVGR